MNKLKNPIKKHPYKEFGEWVRNQHSGRSQNWLADLIGVSRPFINQVEKGEKRFSPFHTSKLAVIFKGNIDELASMTGWEYMKLEDLFEKENLLYTHANDLIFQGQTEIDTAQQLRESGKPELALSQLFFWIDLLEKRIKSDIDLLKEIKDLQRILIRAYSMRMVCNNDIQPWTSVISSIKPDYFKALNLANQINDSEGLAIANAWYADAHYVGGDYLTAKEYALSALPSLKKSTTIYAETLRDLILISGYLKDSDGLQTFIDFSKDEIEKGNISAPTDIASIFEGTAKSKIQLGDMDVIPLLELAGNEMQTLNEKKQNRPVIHMQIHRTKLEYLRKIRSLGLILDQTLLGEFTQKAKDSVNTLPDYTRHKKQINSMIHQFQMVDLRSQQTYQQINLF